MRSPKLKLRLGASLRSLIGRLSKNFLRNLCGISFSTNKVYGLGGYPPPALQMEIKICSPKNTDFFSLFFLRMLGFRISEVLCPAPLQKFCTGKKFTDLEGTPVPPFSNGFRKKVFDTLPYFLTHHRRTLRRRLRQTGGCSSWPNPPDMPAILIS